MSSTYDQKPYPLSSLDPTTSALIKVNNVLINHGQNMDMQQQLELRQAQQQLQAEQMRKMREYND
jgi:hypothetical protein